MSYKELATRMIPRSVITMSYKDLDTCMLPRTVITMSQKLDTCIQSLLYHVTKTGYMYITSVILCHKNVIKKRYMYTTSVILCHKN